MIHEDEETYITRRGEVLNNRKQTKSRKRNYRVMWGIDIFDAKSPRDAAKKALQIQRDTNSLATVFDVEAYDDNKRTGDVRSKDYVRIDFSRPAYISDLGNTREQLKTKWY